MKILNLNLLWKWKRTETETPKVRTVVPNHSFVSTVPQNEHPNANYPNNRVRTTKYTALTFIPQNLFEQFHRFANVYFISIVILNWIIAAFGKEISMLPVTFVLGVTAIKDIFEDLRRHKSDRRVNNSTCSVWNGNQNSFESIKWKNLRVGDIVQLNCNEVMPADILILRTSDPDGLCYLETMSLDGETNLKQLEVVPGCSNGQEDNLNFINQFQSKIKVCLPTTQIDYFTGKMVHPDKEKVPLSNKNLLLRDCCLKNTKFVQGLVVYAGRDTKTMLNNGGPRHKRTGLEKLMNSEVLGCVVILAVLCIAGATGSAFWLSRFDRDQVPFIPPDPLKENDDDDDEDGVWDTIYDVFLSFLTFIIILQIMVPLSLYVTIELTKLMQIYHIHNDIEMYDPETNKRIECRATNIPEDLGQIQYIFSDKTGTLTENKMIFRRCIVGGEDFDHSENSCDNTSQSKESKIPSLQINPKLSKIFGLSNAQLSGDSSNGNLRNLQEGYSVSEQRERIREFFLILAICNTVVVADHAQSEKVSDNRVLEQTDGDGGSQYSGSRSSPSIYRDLRDSDSRSGSASLCLPSPAPSEVKPIFQAESPDELSLVEAAFMYNCTLLKRIPQSLTVSMPGEGLIHYEVLHTLPFDSVRKRMSIVVRHPQTNQIILYCKGADSAIFPRLVVSDRTHEDLLNRTQAQIDNYAREGLRTLVMAKRTLSDREYQQWLIRFKQAKLQPDVKNRDALMSECFNKLEKNLELVGATGIEDRLQDRVPETIEALRKAGIKVWVLTGDKQETAVNIAHSCKLFTPAMDIIKLNAPNKETAESIILFYLKEIENMKSQSGTSTYDNDKAHTSDAHSCVPLSGNERALVVDGGTLKYIFKAKTQLITKFLTLTKQCSAVLCCRANPLQKAFMVTSVKEQLRMRTLAIGDGANDVSMIQQADVGIGISGKEGMQAVMASDFAISKFKYLERLLLVHGHWSYDRLARMILYFFYKNAAFVFVIFWFQVLNGWSGSVMIDQMYLMVFNLFFTALPPMAIGIYDQDCPAELLLFYPKLYSQGRLQKVHHAHSFWLNMLDALYQSVIIFFVSYGAYEGSDVEMFEFGTTIVVACMFTMLAHMAIETKSWTIIHVLSIVASILMFYVFAFIYNSWCTYCLGVENPYWVIHELIVSPLHWLIVLVTTMLAVLPRLIVRCLENSLFPSDVTTALLIKRQSSIIKNEDVFVSSTSL